ncbi:unnamed protein product [Nyctereutes procyonoides]|uniref:(raccoon dog) hypothetical protein n=1 Tax=Nyctereutes procyonoides TaxID=34880 RepID=A0A811ZEA1_NYCPR|nr:unnamed protein product [Nyctereutes procyonoides]
MYSYIFRAARVNICRDRGKKISRRRGAFSARDGAGARAEGRPAGPAKGRRGRAAAATWAPLHSRVSLLTHCVTPARASEVAPVTDVAFEDRGTPAPGDDDPGRLQSAGNLDSPNWWCGRHRCPPGFTGLFEGADHSPGSTAETSPPLPSGGLHFPSLHLLVTPERQTSDWPRPSLNAASSRKPVQVDVSIGNRPSLPSPRENRGGKASLGWIPGAVGLRERIWTPRGETRAGPGLPAWPLPTT